MQLGCSCVQRNSSPDQAFHAMVALWPQSAPALSSSISAWCVAHSRADDGTCASWAWIATACMDAHYWSSSAWLGFHTELKVSQLHIVWRSHDLIDYTSTHSSEILISNEPKGIVDGTRKRTCTIKQLTSTIDSAHACRPTIKPATYFKSVYELRVCIYSYVFIKAPQCMCIVWLMYVLLKHHHLVYCKYVRIKASQCVLYVCAH